MSLRTLFLACASMVALCATMEAKTVTLTTEDNGVLGAMHRAGCHNDQWLARVMMESGILEIQLNRLPKGKIIVVPDECETSSPAREDIKSTQQVLLNQSTLQSVQKTSTLSDKVVSDLQDANAKLAEQASTIATLKNQVAQLQSISKPASQPKKSREFSTKSTNLLVLLGVVLGGFIASALLILFPFKKLKGEREDLKNLLAKSEQDLREARRIKSQPLSVDFHGKVIVFSDTTKYTRACPCCSETKILPHNMRDHLTNVHPHLRLHKANPGEVKQLLGIPA